MSKSTDTIEWSRSNAFISGDLVGTVVQTYGGPLLGVWCGEGESMLWYPIAPYETTHDMLTGMHKWGALEFIPDDADMSPPSVIHNDADA